MFRKLDKESQNKIIRGRPIESFGYFLTHSTLGRFPPDGSAWLIDPTPSDPVDVPDGTFQVKYQTNISREARVVPSHFVPTIDLKGGEASPSAFTASAPQGSSVVPSSMHAELMNDPTYRQIQIEHTKYSYALDLQVRQAKLLQDMRVQHDQADQLRGQQFQRLEIQNHYSSYDDLVQQNVRGALNIARASAELSELIHRQAKAINSGEDVRPQGIGLAQMAVEGLDVIRRLTGGNGERHRDMLGDVHFGGDGLGSEESEVDRVIQQKTKEVREEIDRLRKDAEKAANTETPEKAFMAEIRAMRAELAELRAQNANPGAQPVPMPTPPMAEKPTTHLPAAAPEQPQHAEPAAVALVKSRPKVRRKATSPPAKKGKNKPKRLRGKK